MRTTPRYPPARSIALVAAVWYSQSALAGGPLFVNQNAAPGGDGLSWATAHQSLQLALTAAAGSGGTINEIWVAQGLYRPDEGSNDRAATFLLFSGAIIRGGFAGTESSPAERIPGSAETVLTGDIGIPGDSADNSFHVVSMRTIFAPATIERFTIRYGRADAGSFPNNSGGGLLTEGSMQIIDCVFENNFGVSGGGVYSRFGAAGVSGCAFRSNIASSEGGGLALRDAGTVASCEFTGNNAAFGGGLWTCCGTIGVADCNFESNFGNFGGGLFNSSGPLALKRSDFINNSASRGGAVYSGNGAWLVNCFLGGNSGDRGGALYASAAGNVVNCVFSRNFALSSGGGAWAAAGVAFSNCTSHGNNALLFGGGLYAETGASSLSNCILWANTDNTGTTQGSQATRVGGTLAVNSTCVQGWTGSLGGTGNIGAPPLFVLPNGTDGVPGTRDDDLRLITGSPCIDTGDRALIPADATDLDNDADTAEPTPIDLALSPRAIESVFQLPNAPVPTPPIDMGAIEFVPPPRIPGDANGDQLVGFADITAVLVAWGQTLVPADVNDNGTADFADLTMVLANWAP